MTSPDPFPEREQTLRGIFSYADELAATRQATIRAYPGQTGKDYLFNANAIGLFTNGVAELALSEVAMADFLADVAPSEPTVLDSTGKGHLPAGFDYRLWIYRDAAQPENQTRIYTANLPLTDQIGQARLVMTEDATANVTTQIRLTKIGDTSKVTSNQQPEEDNLLHDVRFFKTEGDELNPESFYSFAIATLMGNAEAAARIVSWHDCPNEHIPPNVWDAFRENLLQRNQEVRGSSIPAPMLTEEGQLKSILKTLSLAIKMPAPDALD